MSDAVSAMKAFLAGYPGLKRLKEEVIPKDVQRGYFLGFDGRPVVCDSDHKMLAGYLQNGETVVMKTANRIWYQELKRLEIPFKQVGFIHDEFQTEVLDQNNYPEIVAKIQATSIRQAGEILNLRCPQAGNYKLGLNWLDTH